MAEIHTRELTADYFALKGRQRTSLPTSLQSRTFQIHDGKPFQEFFDLRRPALFSRTFPASYLFDDFDILPRAVVVIVVIVALLVVLVVVLVVLVVTLVCIVVLIIIILETFKEFRRQRLLKGRRSQQIFE
jgi:hypothetical protein